MEFTKVLDGVVEYLDKEIFVSMADWQQMIARIAIGRIYENKDKIVNTLTSNGIVRAFNLVDGEGNLDVERLMKDIKTEINRAGKIEIKIPMFGKLTFKPEDVDVLHKTITGGNYEDY